MQTNPDSRTYHGSYHAIRMGRHSRISRGQPKHSMHGEVHQSRLRLNQRTTTEKARTSQAVKSIKDSKLKYPVYHGNMLDYSRKVLRMVCFGCSHLNLL